VSLDVCTGSVSSMVYVCVRESACVCVRSYVCVCVCACVCVLIDTGGVPSMTCVRVCVRERVSLSLSRTHTHVCMCVCVRVYVSVSVYVCVLSHVIQKRCGSAVKDEAHKNYMSHAVHVRFNPLPPSLPHTHTRTHIHISCDRNATEQQPTMESLRRTCTAKSMRVCVCERDRVRGRELECTCINFFLICVKKLICVCV